MGNNNQNFVKSKKINMNILNSLNFQKVRIKKFPVIKILIRNMNKKEEIFNRLRTELTQQSMPIEEDNLDQHALFLSELYLSTISTVEPRIIVNGDNIYLTDKKNAAMIRSLLLCAIRSYILWQQSGGSKFRIFIFKKRIAELAAKL